MSPTLTAQNSVQFSTSPVIIKCYHTPVHYNHVCSPVRFPSVTLHQCDSQVLTYPRYYNHVGAPVRFSSATNPSATLPPCIITTCVPQDGSQVLPYPSVIPERYPTLVYYNHVDIPVCFPSATQPQCDTTHVFPLKCVSSIPYPSAR